MLIFPGGESEIPADILGYKNPVMYLQSCISVVTGCTDGIGRAYSLELAHRGIKKFLLLGRNIDKLEAVAVELSK